MQPAISLIVPTTKAWPHLRDIVTAVERQDTNDHIELVMADGHGQGVPDSLGPSSVIVRRPGADVFELRAAGVRAASGRIIAMLEDHCFPEPDYCSNVIRAFAEHPDAAGVLGSIRNGAPQLLDRASFLITWAPFLAPLDHVPADRCPAPGAVAYRREALELIAMTPGRLEYELPVILRDQGRLVADDRMRVVHIQHLGRRAFALQFHAGVAYTGLEHEPRSSVPRRHRLREAMTSSSRIARQTSDALRRRPDARETVLARVAIVLLAGCNGVGQTIGVLTGRAGKSPSHLE